MSEPRTSTQPEPEGEALDFNALDVAGYLFQLSDEMAAMADAIGFAKVAAALELARTLCAEELAAAVRQSR